MDKFCGNTILLFAFQRCMEYDELLNCNIVSIENFMNAIVLYLNRIIHGYMEIIIYIDLLVLYIYCLFLSVAFINLFLNISF